MDGQSLEHWMDAEQMLGPGKQQERSVSGPILSGSARKTDVVSEQ